MPRGVGYGNDKKGKPKKKLGPAGTIKLNSRSKSRKSAISMSRKSKPMKLGMPNMPKRQKAPTINITVGKVPRSIPRPGNKAKRKK